MTPEVGTLACTAVGGLVVRVEAERYRIASEDVRSLIFAGRPAPATCSRVRRTGDIITGEVTIEGHAAIHPARRSPRISRRRRASSEGREVRPKGRGCTARERHWRISMGNATPSWCGSGIGGGDTVRGLGYLPLSDQSPRYPCIYEYGEKNCRVEAPS